MQSVLLQWLSQGRNCSGQQTLKQGNPQSPAINGMPELLSDSDSDSELPSPSDRPYASASVITVHSASPSPPIEVPAADNVQVLFEPAVENHNDSDSSDSEDPISRGARRYVASLTAQRHRDSAVVEMCTVDAAEYVNVDEVADVDQPATGTGIHVHQNDPRIVMHRPFASVHHPGNNTIKIGHPFTGVAIKHEHGGPIDLLNLWKSVPPRSTQFLDLEAKHDSDDDSGISTSESGDLTPGFISDNDDCVSKADDNTADMNVLAEMLPVTARRVREVHGKRQRL